MLNISIDGSGLDTLVNADNSSEILDELPAKLAPGIGAVFQAHWDREVEAQLSTSKREYRNAMEGPDITTGPRQATITFGLNPDNQVANIVERGQPAGVQQLHGKVHVVYGKDGQVLDRYQNVPFKHTTPSKSADALRRPMMGASHINVRGRAGAHALGKAIYAEMKRGQGARLGAGFQGVEKLKQEFGWLRPHTTDLYEGLTGTGGEYTTWRRLRESDPWPRKEIAARDLLGSIARRAESIVRPVVEGYLTGILGASQEQARKVTKIR